jgi:predicted phosphodiesterase
MVAKFEIVNDSGVKKLEELVTAEERKVLTEMRDKGYDPSSMAEFMKSISNKGSNIKRRYSIGSFHAKLLIFGDPHMGNINYKPDFFSFMVKTSKEEKVDLVLCTGDIFDGWYQNRPSSIFEQNAIGFDQQMKLAVNELSKFDKPLYFITGNHSYNTFVRGAGVEAGPYLEDKLCHMGLEAHYLGNGEGDVSLGSGTKIRLLHPDGGTAYAISYKSQKIVESLTGGEKPNMLLIGHFHKAEYIIYRNVHVLQTATLCGQTKFMKGKGIPAHIGFWIVDVYSKKGGEISRIKPEYFPAYK